MADEFDSLSIESIHAHKHMLKTVIPDTVVNG